MYLLIIGAVACFAIAMAVLDQQNKRLKRENQRLRAEITHRYRYATKVNL